MAILDSALQQIQNITVESAYFPPLVLDKPFEPGPPNVYLQALKPKITIKYKSKYLKDTKMAPYGEPVPNYWPKVKIGLITSGAITMIALGWILTKIR